MRALHQPDRCTFATDAPVICTRWRIQSKTELRTSVSQHRRTASVFAIHDLRAITPEDARFGRRITIHSIVAIKMIFGDVKHHGSIRVQRVSRFELKAGKLKHPYRRLFAATFTQRIQHGGRDVARHLCIQTDRRTHRSNHTGDGCLSVCTCDRNDFGLRFRYIDLLCQQFDVAFDRNAARDGALHERLGQRHTGADGDSVYPLQQLLAERAALHVGMRQLAAQYRDTGRGTAAVGHAQARTLRAQIAREREPGLTETEHQH